MVVVPLLNKMFGLEQKKAQATALFVILPISLVSTIVYMCYHSIDFAEGWPVIVGIIVGGVIGAFLLNKIKNNVIKGIFIFFMLLGGVGMLIWWLYDILGNCCRNFRWNNRRYGNGWRNTHNTYSHYLFVIRPIERTGSEFDSLLADVDHCSNYSYEKSFGRIQTNMVTSIGGLYI